MNIAQSHSVLNIGTVYRNPTLFGVLFLVSVLSFFTTLTLPYLGEEGVYTITSLEMAFHQDWMAPTLCGQDYGRPPLFNWLIIVFANILGWEHILLAARLVAVLATTVISFVLLWLMQTLFQDKRLSLFTALTYFSSDLLFRRGWLAYADPLFSLFVFTAIASTWVALKTETKKWLVLSSISLIAAFLTKAFTGYVFYVIAGGVLCGFFKNRRFLLSFFSLGCHGIAFGFPLVWSACINRGTHANSMIWDVVSKFSIQDIMQYFGKLLYFPVDTLIRFLPLSVLLIYYGWQNRRQLFLPHPVKIAIWIAFCNYLPYWIAPHTYIRYLLPLYPFVAIAMAWIFYQFKDKQFKIIMGWLVACIILRYGLGLYGFEYYEKKYRGDYHWAAKDILEKTGNQVLYANTDAASGLSVVAEVDVLQFPHAHLVHPPRDWDSGFVISSDEPTLPEIHIKQTYIFGRQKVYLLCKGQACKASNS